MAKLEQLLEGVSDAKLRAELEAEVAALKGRTRFGLVYERHLPETVVVGDCDGLKVGDHVRPREEANNGHDFRLVKLDGEEATIVSLKDDMERKVPLADLLTVVNARDARDLLGFPGLWRLAGRYVRTGAGEIWRDLVKRAAARQMRRYLPDLEARHIKFGPCGVRAQVLARDGTLIDDFLLERDGNVLHVVNAPSPGATASLAIGRRLAEQLE